MSFADIPIRENGKGFIIMASWFNIIRTKLISAFGSGGYIKEQPLQQVTNLGEFTVDSEAFKPMLNVEGDGGAVVTSATPFGVAHGFTGGKEIILVGNSDTNTVTVEVNDVAGGVIANGKIVLSKFRQVKLIYNETLDRFIREE